LAQGREKLWFARGEKVCVAFWESPRRGRRALWFFSQGGSLWFAFPKTKGRRGGGLFLVSEGGGCREYGFLGLGFFFCFPPQIFFRPHGCKIFLPPFFYFTIA